MQYSFVWFPDDDALGIKTCRNILCDIMIQISKEQYCAFSWSEYWKLLIIDVHRSSRKVPIFLADFNKT
jgi:hypothetical protein